MVYYDKHVVEINKDAVRQGEKYKKALNGFLVNSTSGVATATDRYRALVLPELSDNSPYQKIVDDRITALADTKRFFSYYIHFADFTDFTTSDLKPLSARSRSGLVQLTKTMDGINISRVDEDTEELEYLTTIPTLFIKDGLLSKPSYFNERYLKQMLAFVLAFKKANHGGTVELSLSGGITPCMVIGRDSDGQGAFKYVLCAVSYTFKNSNLPPD